MLMFGKLSGSSSSSSTHYLRLFFSFFFVKNKYTHLARRHNHTFTWYHNHTVTIKQSHQRYHRLEAHDIYINGGNFMSQQQLVPLSERRFRSVMVVWLSQLLLLLLLFFFIVALHFFCFCLFWSSHILTDNIKVMRNLWKKINGDSRRCVRVLGTCKIDVAIDNFSVFSVFFSVCSCCCSFLILLHC